MRKVTLVRWTGLCLEGPSIFLESSIFLRVLTCACGEGEIVTLEADWGRHWPLNVKKSELITFFGVTWQTLDFKLKHLHNLGGDQKKKPTEKCIKWSFFKFLDFHFSWTNFRTRFWTRGHVPRGWSLNGNENWGSYGHDNLNYPKYSMQTTSLVWLTPEWECEIVIWIVKAITPSRVQQTRSL